MRGREVIRVIAVNDDPDPNVGGCKQCVADEDVFMCGSLPTACTRFRLHYEEVK